jgi:hypothetical protein
MQEFQKFPTPEEGDMSTKEPPVNEDAVIVRSSISIFSRIAIYDNMKSIPRVIDFNHDNIDNFLAEIPQKVYSLSHDLGGKIPYTILKEVIENLIHANFQDIIISIMDNGNYVIISDQGPGILDKEKAFLPGYTSATRHMKKYIRGVGSGLPIVKETIVFSGGSIDIKDNLSHGTVVSLRIGTRKLNNDEILSFVDLSGPAQKTTLGNRADITVNASRTSIDADGPDSSSHALKPDPTTVQKNLSAAAPARSSNTNEDLLSLKLTIRHKKILSLILELEESGPAKIAKELNFSLSTSYRELVFLESIKLLELTDSGKRKLTLKAKKYLEYYSNSF